MSESFGRISVLASSTFTQLVRMKAFYFLVLFVILVSVAGTMNIMSYNAEQQLKHVKDVPLGAMRLFASIFAIVATAMLIPRDIEDRTLYTILAKPVPRVEYLIGKLFGVIAVIGVSLVVMHLFFTLVVYLRQEALLGDELALQANRPDMTQEDLAAYAERVRAQGVSWNLLNATLGIFLMGCVVAASTMLLSTVASTSLFTVIVAVLVLFIGHVQGLARDYWTSGGEAAAGLFTKFFIGIVALVFPDYQLFNIVDGVVAGTIIPLMSMVKLAGLTLLYLAIYTLVAWLIFGGKEL